jgi:hypothetical protein
VTSMLSDLGLRNRVGGEIERFEMNLHWMCMRALYNDPLVSKSGVDQADQPAVNDQEITFLISQCG